MNEALMRSGGGKTSPGSKCKSPRKPRSKKKSPMAKSAVQSIIGLMSQNFNKGDKPKTPENKVIVVLSPKTLIEEEPDPKKNAFDLMMCMRHKSIGQNSPGKDLNVIKSSPEEVDERRKITSARKEFLQQWSDMKGSSQRIKEYEERGNTIVCKLEERSEKLKKMLTAGTETQSDDENITNMKRRYNRIESDSENSQDTPIKRHKRLKDISSPSPKSMRRWRIKMKDNTDLTPTKTSPEPDIDAKTNTRVLRTRKVVTNLYKEEENEDKKPNNKKTTKKVAPVFMKSMPKPIINPEVSEARRKFLLSGIPHSLIKELQKQQNCPEDVPVFEKFPTISHVQQKSESEKFWDLPSINFHLKPIEKPLLTYCSEIKLDDVTEEPHNVIPTSIIEKPQLKPTIKELKLQNPNIPINKMFKTLYHQSRCENSLDSTIESNTSNVDISMNEVEKNFTLWTEKYRAKTSKDMIIGNQTSISTLRTWLEGWQNRKRKEYDSASEFDISDGDSRDSAKMASNSVFLIGPNGCGKSAAVYAVSLELDLDVLEVNASSKRTGKWLLQELQEATQSHQLHKKDKLKGTKRPKMCVLLVEDVDLVFDQDEGFIGALTQILNTSKRPIICTTNHESSPIVQKFLTHQQTITFAALTTPSASLWLHILCLIEGAQIDTNTIGYLLARNKGDIRRTLLQLQVWVTTGNNIIYNLNRNKLDSYLWWSVPFILQASKDKCPKKTLKLASDFYDALLFVDLSSNKETTDDICERRRYKINDGLELCNEPKSYQDTTLKEITDFLYFSTIKRYRTYCDTDDLQNMEQPPREKLKFYGKQRTSEIILQQAIQPSIHLARKAVALDYMPTLREIGRSESERALQNPKRTNRFYNYLRSVGISACEAKHKSAHDIFRTVDNGIL